MSCGIVLPGGFRHLAATASGLNTDRIEPFTGWVPCTGMDTVRALLRFRALTNQFQARPAIQLAAVRTDKPDAWTLLDAMRSADKYTDDLAVSTGGKMYARFGAAYNLSTGSTLGEADVGLDLVYRLCGTMVGTVTLQLVAPDTSTYYVPVTGFLPAHQFAKFKSAVVVSSASNGFKHKLTYRAATIDQETITVAWGTDSLDAFVTGDTERNTGELTLPTSGGASIADKMWIQIGLAYSGAGAGAGATVTVTTATRT